MQRDGKKSGPEEVNAHWLSLGAGEGVALVTRPSRIIEAPKYLLTAGLYGLWRRRHTMVVTNRRVIVGQGIISRREHSIPLNSIEETVCNRRIASAFCDLTFSVGGTRRLGRMGPFTARTAKRFMAEVESRK